MATQSKQGKGSKATQGKATAVVSGAVAPAVRQGERVFEQAKRDGNRVGLTHGLLLTAWWNGVLDAMVVGGAQWTDAQLAAAVLAEYPNRGAHQSPTAYRSYYNGQRHGLGGAGLNAKPYREPKAVAPAPVAPKAPAPAAVAPVVATVVTKGKGKGKQVQFAPGVAVTPAMAKAAAKAATL